MEKPPNIKKKHVTIIVVSIVMVVVLTVLFIIFNMKTSTLSIKVAPHDATITINQQVYQNNSSKNFRPGNYTVTVSKEGFKEETLSLELLENQTTTLNLYLLDDNPKDNGFSYYKTNYDDLYFLREYYNSHQDDEKLKAFIENYDKALTIQKILPLYYYDNKTGDSYYVIYKTDPKQCNELYCLEIGASDDEAYNKSLQIIKEKGFDINDYQIIKHI